MTDIGYEADLLELALENCALQQRLDKALYAIDCMRRERELAAKLVDNQETMIEALRDTVERQEEILQRIRAKSPEAKIDKWSAEITGRVRKTLN